MSNSPAQIRERVRAQWATRTKEYASTSTESNSQAAASLLDLVAPQPGEQVLDIATGYGVVALQAARLVGPGGQVVATDLVPEWEDMVSEGSADAGLTNVSFRAMGAEALDFPDASFDVVCCQFGLMFVPDRPQALREMRRVLRPGGRLGLAVWGTPDQVPLHMPARIVAEVVPPAPDAAGLPGPLALGEPGLVERLVEEAGFASIEVQHRTVERVVTDPEAYWQQMLQRDGGALAATLADRPEDAALLRTRLMTFLESYRRGAEIHLPGTAILVAARRPQD